MLNLWKDTEQQKMNNIEINGKKGTIPYSFKINLITYTLMFIQLRCFGCFFEVLDKISQLVGKRKPYRKTYVSAETEN